MLLGDEVDATRRRANAFVDGLAQTPTPAAVIAVDALFQMLPSICFVLQDHVLERLAFLQRALFDSIPFLRDAHRGDVALPRDVATGAIDAAIALCAADASVTESVVDDVTRILGQIATEFAFRHVESDDDSTIDAAAGDDVSEQRVVAHEVRRLLEQITALSRFANALQQRTRALYERDVEELRRVVVDDAQRKNAQVEVVMREMQQYGRAVWPLTRTPDVPLSAIASQLPSCERAQFLSCHQSRALVIACLECERATSAPPLDLPHDEFVALVLECAQRCAFPPAWQSATALASAVRASARSSRTLSWRAFIVSLLCTQFVDCPSDRDLVALLQHAQALGRPRLVDTQTPDDEAQYDGIELTRDAFSQLLPLWIKRGASTRAQTFVAELTDLAFDLFSSSERGEEPTVALTPMLLHWCVYPPRSSPAIRDDLAVFLPAYARGLGRAFRVLAHAMAARDSTASTRVVGTRHVRALFAFACISIDDDRLCELTRDRTDASRLSWCVDSAADMASLVDLCDALAPALAQQFVFVNPLAALLRRSSS